MSKESEMMAPKGSMWKTASFGISAVILVVSIISDPGQTFAATLQGLSIWWHIVFPALLPFLMLTEMLIAYGFVHGLGTLLSPLLRRVFRIPGESGYVIPLGLIAGFPAGAEAAAKLYGKSRISADEASRLAAIAHFCNPMLLIVVIGTGFIHTPALGVLLSFIHITAGIASAITYAMLNKDTRYSSSLSTTKRSTHVPLLKQVIRNMEIAHRLDGRSFGKLLGDTVSVSVQSLMRVGGYILIFALIIQVISRAWPHQLPTFILPALLEVHLGSFQITEASWLSPAMQAAILGAGLGWGGLCGYFQVRAVLKPAGIRSRGFLTIRVLHGAYAYILTLLIWKPVTTLFPQTSSVYRESTSSALSRATLMPNWHETVVMIGWQACSLIILLGSILVVSMLFLGKKHER